MTALLKPILYSLVVFLVVGVSAASGLSVTAETVQIPSVGDTTILSIVLDAAPNGLSGSNISVSLDDPSIAEFIDVTYPGWMTLTESNPLPNDTIFIKGFDGGEEIDPGATDVDLGTVTVRGDAVGISAVTVSIIRLDDELGDPVVATPVDGSVTVGDPPVADFSGTPQSGDAPLTVQFTDESSGDPTSWSWTFGDGETSAAQSPEHTYTAAGTYTVSLTATNGAGSDTETKIGYITVDEPPAPLSADFSGTPRSGDAPLTVQFTDASSGDPTSWSWDFGDGDTSNAQNPEHTYAAAGTYTVSLTVSKGVFNAGIHSSRIRVPHGAPLTASNGGESDTETKTDYITVTEPSVPPVAVFSGTPTSGDVPLTVQFTDGSSGVPTSWSWAFGDGETSVVQNPEYTYTAAGTYTVSLTVSNAVGEDTLTETDYILVTAPPNPPVAGFSATPQSGDVPLIVQFTDASTGSPTSWSWVFGDGETSTAQSPSHTYTAAGTYTVTLTATNPDGSDSETKTGYIAVTEPPAPPVAAFSGTPTSGDAPLTVQFTDASNGDPTSWSWTFGDGGTSAAQNPEHTYTAAGTYTVSLTATSSAGSDTETRTGYITVDEPPVLPVAEFTGTPRSGDAPLTVQFTDASGGDPISWSWDFGDGGTSDEQNPEHTYTTAGTYTVSLDVTNADGSDTEEKAGYITVTEPLAPPVAAFSATPLSGIAPLTVQFTDESTGEIDACRWDFGDGSTSTEADPLHTYSAAGTYTVLLTVTNGAGSCAEEKVACVCVSPPGGSEETSSKIRWMKRPQEIAPLLPIWLGTPGGSDSIQVTDRVQAVAIMAQKSRWNGIPLLQGELLAAKLNIKAGCDPAPVEETIALADAFLADHNDFDWFRMSPRQWAAVNSWIDALEAYNNS